MGFKNVKARVIKCLREGNYEYEARHNIDVKNIFMIGDLNAEDLIELIQCTNGKNYETRLHHLDSSIEIHILKPIKDMKKWYIKFYFLDPKTVFISVHESE